KRYSLLASPQGGVAASSSKFRAATEARRSRGGFPFVLIGKPPRPRDQRRLRNNFLIARPPLLAVMQGGESPYSNFFTASMTADWRLAILMGQLARHVGGCYKCRYFFANICLHRSVILVLHLLMAAPYRACIRSAHVF